ncbi:MAG: hypothetical protein AAGB24_13150 [Bacteroidota bacterium]
MKRKIHILIVLLLSTVATLLYLINPQIFKLIWFQKQDVKTHENFPFGKMQQSPNPFVFSENIVVKNRLDFLLAKIGRLMLKNGTQVSTQIISSDWIDKSFAIKPENWANAAKGIQRAPHQYNWWLPQEDLKGDFSTKGLRRQRLYVNPDKNIIIVQSTNGRYRDYPYRAIAKHFAENRDWNQTTLHMTI